MVPINLYVHMQLHITFERLKVLSRQYNIIIVIIIVNSSIIFGNSLKKCPNL